jgi:hypothetical protein
MSADTTAKDVPQKTSTAARVAVQSGPAATTAEARKNKKKKPISESHITAPKALLTLP